MSWAAKFEKVQVARTEGDDENASLLMDFGEVGKSVQDGFNNFFSSLNVMEKKNDGDVEAQNGRSSSKSDGSMLGGLANAFRSEETERPVLGMSYIARFRAFISLNILAILFFMLAFFVGLPTVVLRPAKFAISFTTGSLMIMLAFAVLKGPWTHLKTMCTKEVAPFSALYVGSMLGTLYASLVARSYLLVMLMSAAQLTALGYYMVAGIPGGAQGLSLFITGMRKTISALCYPFCLACKACMRALTGL